MKANLANPHGADLNKYLKAGAPKPEFKRSRANEPTVDQIQSDNLTALAKTYWAPQTKKNHVDFNMEVVTEIYQNDIKAWNKRKGDHAFFGVVGLLSPPSPYRKVLLQAKPLPAAQKEDEERGKRGVALCTVSSYQCCGSPLLTRRIRIRIQIFTSIRVRQPMLIHTIRIQILVTLAVINSWILT
jgi:hypothetical protein